MDLRPAFDFGAFPTLTTPRLVLREIVPGDADAIFVIRGDARVTRHNTGAPYLTVGEARGLIRTITVAWEKRAEIRWGVTLRGDDTVIGMVGYNSWDRMDRRGCVGYDLAFDCWNRGYMTEALTAVIGWGFENMALNRVEADVSAENPASARVLEKLGFAGEGRRREHYFDLEDGRFRDLLLYGLLRRDWRPLPTSS